MSHKKSIPCYIANGGVHNVVNFPMGVFMRGEMKKLCRELLKNLDCLQTFVAAEATPRTIKLLRGLSAMLEVDLKPIKNRRMAKRLLSANEKNLKPSEMKNGSDDDFNMVDFAVSCGLIGLLYILSAHLEYLANL